MQMNKIIDINRDYFEIQSISLNEIFIINSNL